MNQGSERSQSRTQYPKPTDNSRTYTRNSENQTRHYNNQYRNQNSGSHWVNKSHFRPANNQTHLNTNYNGRSSSRSKINNDYNSHRRELSYAEFCNTYNQRMNMESESRNEPINMRVNELRESESRPQFNQYWRNERRVAFQNQKSF